MCVAKIMNQHVVDVKKRTKPQKCLLTMAHSEQSDGNCFDSQQNQYKNTEQVPWLSSKSLTTPKILLYTGHTTTYVTRSYVNLRIISPD